MMQIENPIAFPYRKMEYIEKFIFDRDVGLRYVGQTHNLAPICLIIIDEVVPFVSVTASPWEHPFEDEFIIPVMFAPHINDVLIIDQPKEAYVVNLHNRNISLEALDWIKENSLAFELIRGNGLLLVNKIVFKSVAKVAEFNLRIS